MKKYILLTLLIYCIFPSIAIALEAFDVTGNELMYRFHCGIFDGNSISGMNMGGLMDTKHIGGYLNINDKEENEGIIVNCKRKVIQI